METVPCQPFVFFMPVPVVNSAPPLSEEMSVVQIRGASSVALGIIVSSAAGDTSVQGSPWV